MNRKPLLFVAACAATILTCPATAQVKIGNNPQTIDPSSLLELESPNKALYLSRASLTSTTDVATIPNPKAGMTVYNTNAAITGSAANPVLAGGKGVYYYDGARWVGTGNPANASANEWHLTGNAGTVDGINFLGTTDNVPLTLRVNNQPSLRLDATLANAFMGYQAGGSNTSGESNTFVGHLSGQQNTSGSKNTGLGREALFGATGTGSENTALGYASMPLNTSGGFNTATGSRSLNKNSTGAYNVANGYQAGFMNTSGNGNTAVGASTAYFNTSGSGNTSVGASALFTNTIGQSNTAVGFSAGQVSTASNNTFMGSQAGYNTTTGGNNVFEGYQGGAANTTGSNNTTLGSGADLTANNLTNAAAIGYNAKAGASNTLILGGTGSYAVSVGIGTSTPRALLDVVGTSGIILPSGTTAQQPAGAAAVPGMIRFNATTHRFEGYTDDTNTTNSVYPEPGWVNLSAN